MRLAHHMLTWVDWHRGHDIPLDVDAMLRAIRTTGYDGVELIGGKAQHGPAAELTRRLTDHGLRAAAYSSFVNAVATDDNTRQYRAEMDLAASLGITTVMVCGGFLGEPRRTMFEDDYTRFAENLATATEYARGNGQTLAFHPHTGCMVETAEEVERLLTYLPDLQLCVDTGHLAAVRSDPVTLVDAHPDRIAHVHLKDWDPRTRSFAEPGQGDAGLDFAAFLAALDRAGYQGWLVVERDRPTLPPAESARVSHDFLANLPTPAA